jgi:hypothetical protein
MGVILALVSPFLTLLGSILGKHPSASDPTTPIPSWLTAIENLVSVAGEMNGSWVNDAQLLLGAVTANGAQLGIPANVLTGVGNVNNILTTYAATAKDYISGQVAVIGKFSFEGVGGTSFALSDAGLSNPIAEGVTTIGGALGVI